MDEKYTDQQLIEKIKNEQDSEAFKELSERHGGLFTQIITRNYHKLSNISGVFFQDILEEKTRLLYDSVFDYDEKRAQFNTHFGNKIKFFCKELVSEPRLQLASFETPEKLNEAIDKNHQCMPEISLDDEGKRILTILSNQDDKLLSKIVYMRYFLPEGSNSVRAIAKTLKMSHQGVYNKLKRAGKILKGYKSLEEVRL